MSLAGYLLRRNHFAINAAIPPVPAVLPATMAAAVATHTGHIGPSVGESVDLGRSEEPAGAKAPRLFLVAYGTSELVP